jgi:hypothetical protein
MESEVGLQQGSVLRPVLYLISTSDLPTSDNTTTATFADDTAILATHEDLAIASMKLQATINKIEDWAKKWIIKINRSKYTHITFTLRNQICPTGQMDNVTLLHKKEVKYLIDRLVKHNKTQTNQLNLKAKQMH